jgi:hypothetical protein
MTTRELDPKVVEAFADHHERLGRLAFVNPVLIEEPAASAIAAASRLLAFEQWLDRLEQKKRDEGSLDPDAEYLAAEAFVRAENDARTLASNVIDVVRPLSRAGFFDEAIPYACEAIKRIGSDIDMATVFASAREPMTEMLAQRGMDPQLSSLLFRAVDEARDGYKGLTLNCHDSGVLFMQRKGRRTSMQPHNIAKLPLLDGNTWIYGGLLRTLHTDKSAVRDGVPRTSPWGGVLALAKALVENYEDRARRTAEEGVHVYSTGFFWFIFILIVIIVAIVATVVVLVLCAVGVVKNKTICTIAFILLAAALFMGCVESGGDTTVGGGENGIAALCTLKSDGPTGIDG